MALYFFFNDMSGDLVYSDQDTIPNVGYMKLGEQTNTHPANRSDWVFDSHRTSIITVSKDVNISARINVLTSMALMFFNSESLRYLDLSGFDTSNVTDMNGMFYDCGAMTSLDLSNFDTSNVTDMHHMFRGCGALTSLDLGSFDTSNVTDMNGMFYNCKALTSLNLSSFSTSKVTYMNSVFYGCLNLAYLDLNGFDTSNVTRMQFMFYRCTDLTSLDLSNFDTSKARDMSYMFSSCDVLASLDLSSFDTSNVTDMSSMFESCESLISLDLSNFDTSNVTDMNDIFASCSALRIIDISSNMSNVLVQLPAATYYDAVTRQSYTKADIPGGSTYVRNLADLDLVATMVQTRMGINVAKRLAQKALRKAGSIDIGGTNVDVVRVDSHQTSYDRDTLEIATDSSGKVTEMWFVTAN